MEALESGLYDMNLFGKLTDMTKFNVHNYIKIS